MIALRSSGGVRAPRRTARRTTHPPKMGRRDRAPRREERRPTPPPEVGRRVLATIVLVLVATVVVRLTVAGAVRVESSSMSPTLDQGDVVLVTRWAPRPDVLRRGDVVVLRMPTDGRRAIKRVVALGGDTVVILDARLHVNGRPVSEPYVDRAAIDGYYSRTWTVPPGTVFVLGDNRGNSIDSRDYGPVAAQDLLGRVVVTLWPPG